MKKNAKLLFSRGVFVAATVDKQNAPHLRNEQGDPLLEIAFAGRSNVGKSSLINHLVQTPGLARTSSSPGKTQTINFFSVEERLLLVDLPGYGYAKVPQHIRKEWGRFISEYLLSRKELKAILLLLDIRRTPSEEDVAMAEWAARHKKPLIFIFTKADKVKPHEREPLVRAAMQPFSLLKDLESFPPIFYSVQEKFGRDQLIRTLNTLWAC
jgi:GTP-binding protein